MPVLLPEDPSLSYPVSCHPDMLVFSRGRKLIITAEYYGANKALFDGLGRDIVTTEEKTGRKYPHDVLLNALAVGDILFARTRSVSAKIRELYSAGDTVDVKQGYTACSCCKAGERALITSDAGIAAAAAGRAIDVLTVSPGHVGIDVYPTGFIGGASFCVGDRVYFFGDPDRHPDSDRIIKFLNSHGLKAVALSDGELFDFGGATALI